MLGNFSKAFSQVATSQGYFPKWQLPKGIFTGGNFPILCHFPSSNFPCSDFPILCHFISGNFPSLFKPKHSAAQPIRVALIVPYFSLWRLRRSNLTFKNCCRLGNLTCGEFPPGKLSLGKSNAWENASGKIFNKISKFFSG